MRRGKCGLSGRDLAREHWCAILIAADSQHFFVNDASGSTDTLGYVYDPVTLKATALADVVTSADPDAKKYLGAGHSYLEANRWINSHELSVTLWGHFDEERVGSASSKQ
jgi:hypothetical protein